MKLYLPFSLTLAKISIISHQTTKPKPPVIIRNAVVNKTSGLCAKFARLLFPKISIPALQNADIELNTEYHIPLGTPYSLQNEILYNKAPRNSIQKVPFITLNVNFFKSCFVFRLY